MNWIDVSAILVLASMLLVLIRAARGPHVFDRVLSTNAFGSNTVVFILILALAFDNDMLIDIALVYALINFVGTIALLKYATFGRFDGNESAPLKSQERVNDGV